MLLNNDRGIKGLNHLPTLLGTFLFLGYAGLLLLLIWRQDSMVYYPDQPTRELIATPDLLGLPYDSVYFETQDHQKLHAWFVPAHRQQGTVLFFHGNAGNISHRLESILIFHQLDLSVFIFDYRGYGNSSGTPSEPGTELDAQAAVRFLTDYRRTNPNQLIYFGRSLGGAIAARLAARYPPKALILESTFTSAPDMAGYLLPLFPMRWLTRYSYNTVTNIKAVHCPVLIIHGLEDEIIPYQFGRELYETANEPKQFLTIHGGHNEGFLQSGQTYIQGLKQFLTNVFNDQKPGKQ